MRQGEEQRRHPRVVSMEAAELAPAGGAAGPCVLEDLSAGGARITAREAVAPGQQVALTLSGGPPLAATVVYHFGVPGGGHGYGLAFLPAARPLARLALGRRAAGRPRLLVVYPEGAACRALVRDLAAVGAPAAAAGNAGVGRLLADRLAPSLTHVLLEAQLAEADETDLLAHLAEAHPAVGRVLLCDPASPPMAIRRRAAPPCIAWRPPWAPADLERLLGSLPPGPAPQAAGPGAFQATRE